MPLVLKLKVTYTLVVKTDNNEVKKEMLVAQSCPTLCDPVDCSPPGSSVHGVLQAEITGVGCHAFLQEVFPT